LKKSEEVSWSEAREAARNITGLVEVLYDSHQKELKRRWRLIKNPNGFHLDGTHSCTVCRSSVSDKDTWYDQLGIKCTTCQQAVDNEVIPKTAVKDESSWYSKLDIDRRFNIGTQTMKKLIRDDVLTARIIKKESGKPHAYMFLTYENRDVLPPKHITEHCMVSEETENGETRHRLKPWYKFVHVYEAYSYYKILEHADIEYKNGGVLEN